MDKLTLTASKASCTICNRKVKRHSGITCCFACSKFFKMYGDRQLNELPRVENCTGSCSQKVRKCSQCRMRQCLANGMSMNRVHIKASDKKLEKTPKEKTPSATKELSSSGRKSKLSLKSTRQSQNCEEISETLAKWTWSGKEEMKTVNKPSEKMEKNPEKHETEVQIPCVASLHNLGNTCFLNSVLQVLRYTPQFEEKLSKLAQEIKVSKKERELIAQIQQDDPEGDKDFDTWDVVSHLSEVFQNMKQAEENVMNGSCFIGTRPYDLLDIIGQLNPMFEGDQQQDAHEFLRCLLAYVQDASHSLNRYRKTVAESLGRCTAECIVGEKSVLSSPKQVDLYGGSKRTPANGSKDEDGDADDEREKLMPSFRKSIHEPKLLTELQNHTYTDKKSVPHYSDGRNNRNRDGCENVSTGEVNCLINCDEKKRTRRVSAKRKVCCCEADRQSTGARTSKLTVPELRGTALVAQKKRRLCLGGGEDGRVCPVTAGKCQAHGKVDAVSGSLMPAADTQLNANITKNSSIKVKSSECSQADEKLVPKESGKKPVVENTKSSVTSEKTQDNHAKPVMKELFVRLDKNGIEKYFQKVSKPRSLADIERHVDPVGDCVEELFQGCVELWTRCCECEKVTTRQEDYQDISVAIEQKRQEDDDDDNDDDDDDEGDKGKNEEDHLEKHKNPVDSGSVKDIKEKTGTTQKKANCLNLDDVTSPSEGLVRGLRSSVGRGSLKAEEDFAWIKKSLREVEHLRDDSKYWCENCCHLSEAERSMHYTSVPKVLTLHLKRFAILNGSHRMFTKLTHHMPLPMWLPCIEDNCSTLDKHKLLLYGVIMHTGSTLSGGHYTAYVRAPAGCPGLSFQLPSHKVKPNTEATTSNGMDETLNRDAAVPSNVHQYTDMWFACDDEAVRVLPEKEFITLLNHSSKYTMSPYLLFYHRL